MHVNKKRNIDMVVVLFLAIIFFAGAVVGALTATLVIKVTEDKPAVVGANASTTSTTTQAEPAPEQENPSADAEPKVEHLGKFRLTAYCTCEKCCGEWADGITYTGTEATPGRTIAVDPRVIPLGSTVLVNGVEYTAEDIGGAIKGKRIDVLFPSHREALEFGVQYAEISILK